MYNMLQVIAAWRHFNTINDILQAIAAQESATTRRDAMMKEVFIDKEWIENLIGLYAYLHGARTMQLEIGNDVSVFDKWLQALKELDNVFYD